MYVEKISSQIVRHFSHGAHLIKKRKITGENCRDSLRCWPYWILTRPGSANIRPNISVLSSTNTILLAGVSTDPVRINDSDPDSDVMWIEICCHSFFDNKNFPLKTNKEMIFKKLISKSFLLPFFFRTLYEKKDIFSSPAKRCGFSTITN